MKTAKIVFASIALLAIIGGSLAFKASRFNGTPPLAITLAGITTTTVGLYTATVPICQTVPTYRTAVGVAVNTFSTTTAEVLGTAPDGSQSVITYRTCVPFLTATTPIN